MKLLGSAITKKPVVITLVFLIILVGLIAGAANMKLATGNETLLSTKSKVYKDNAILEQHFGGESIIIMNTSEAENGKSGILTVENFARMNELEDSLKQYEEIYTFVSPASIVLQMTGKQSEIVTENLTEMKDGLKEMGDRLQVIGNEIHQKTNDTSAPDIGSLIDNLQDMNAAFNKMIQGQDKLSEGVRQLNGGYTEFATNLEEISGQVAAIGTQLEKIENAEQFDNSEALQGMKQSKMMAELLAQNMHTMSVKMNQVSTESRPLVNVPNQTAEGLTRIKNELNGQMQQLNGQAVSGDIIGELGELAKGLTMMGQKLVEVSDGLAELISISDIMHVGLPGNQDTLDNLLYEDGELRSVFDELIIGDRHSIIMVKLQGNTSDPVKEDIVQTIKKQLERAPFEGVETIVTGKPVLDSAVHLSMEESMKKMIVIAIMIMFVVLLVVFPVRWRTLAIPIILLSVAATLGLMGHLSVPMTMVSMAVFPILIGLGVDYAIQFQNRYEEELAKEEIVNA
ncbi:MMPL family transporter [Paenibacillus sp. J5C_2022]|uniref:MMPL family transporter n=1 Tax=Paenibacillus sp. J5C2022 TaxID=2977129 RepID=UPI0021D1FED4|nr:MMPL family transporter [Paenibacillus sp. J5C2022]MCU6711546.1 MMPL family transporter [Paenibacillus sp. J5C2022]